MIALAGMILAGQGLMAEASGASGTWDFRATYTFHADGHTSYTILGAAPYVMDCDGGWQEAELLGTSAPDGADMLRVMGSYSSRSLRFERQQNWSMDVHTFSCPGAVSLRPVSVTTAQGASTLAASNGWNVMWQTDVNGAPGIKREDSPGLAPHICKTARFFGNSGLIPFTGSMRLHVTGDNVGDMWWDARTWVLGSTWKLTAADSNPNGRPGSPTCFEITGREVLFATASVGQGSVPVGPAGEWQQVLYSCDGIGTTFSQRKFSCADSYNRF